MLCFGLNNTLIRVYIICANSSEVPTIFLSFIYFLECKEFFTYSCSHFTIRHYDNHPIKVNPAYENMIQSSSDSLMLLQNFLAMTLITNMEVVVKQSRKMTFIHLPHKINSICVLIWSSDTASVIHSSSTTKHHIPVYLKARKK